MFRSIIHSQLVFKYDIRAEIHFFPPNIPLFYPHEHLFPSELSVNLLEYQVAWSVGPFPPVSDSVSSGLQPGGASVWLCSFSNSLAVAYCITPSFLKLFSVGRCLPPVFPSVITRRWKFYHSVDFNWYFSYHEKDCLII